MEQWRTVIYNGEIYENYEVSNGGKVRSLNYNGTGEVRELKSNVSKSGYLSVVLCRNGKYKRARINRIVAFTWIENDNPTEKTVVNHKNEIKTDNRVENLEWCSPKYNTGYGTGLERRAKTQGKRVRCVETQVIYDSTSHASRETGLSQSNICQCCLGKRKTTGGLHFEYVD